MEMVEPVYFCFRVKPANSKFATKTVKKVKLPEEAKRLKFSEISNMDEEDEHSPSKFYYPGDLKTFDIETETGITVSSAI